MKGEHQNADPFKSVASRLQDSGCRVYNATLSFNGAKSTINHSGLIFLGL